MLVLVAIVLTNVSGYAHDTRLKGSTTFQENWAYQGGAIYTSDGDEEDGIPAAITTFPDDTVFEGNRAEVGERNILCCL